MNWQQATLPGIEPPPPAVPQNVAERESCAAMWQRVLEQALREGAGLAPDAAGQLAARQLERLRVLIGGEAIYMPRPSLAPRNAAIRQQFTGGAEGLARVAWRSYRAAASTASAAGEGVARIMVGVRRHLRCLRAAVLRATGQ